MSDTDYKKRKKEFFKSLPESITGPEGDKEYPLKNVQWYGLTFKKKPDGTINIDDIRLSVSSVLKSLYHHGFLTIKPLLVFAEEKTITNVANETVEFVAITSYLDNSGR